MGVSAMGLFHGGYPPSLRGTLPVFQWKREWWRASHGYKEQATTIKGRVSFGRWSVSYPLVSCPPGKRCTLAAQCASGGWLRHSGNVGRPRPTAAKTPQPLQKPPHPRTPPRIRTDFIPNAFIPNLHPMDMPSLHPASLAHPFHASAPAGSRPRITNSGGVQKGHSAAMSGAQKGHSTRRNGFRGRKKCH